MLFPLYLITEMLAPFFGSLLILTGILFLGRLIPLLDTILAFGIGPGDFLRLCAYMLPKLLLFAIPMASMLAVVLAFTRMASENEVMAFNASGTGAAKMAPPVVIFALCTAGLTLLASYNLMPKGTVAMKELFFKLTKEKIHKGIQPKQFSDGMKDLVFYVDRIDQQNGEWQGIVVTDSRRKNSTVTIMAQTGRFHAQPSSRQIIIVLENGSMHSSENAIDRTIQFKRYSLTLPIDLPQGVSEKAAGKIDKNSLQPTELFSRAMELPPDAPLRRSLLIEFHKRLSLPGGCLILSLIGLPLALLSRTGGRSMGITLGLLLFVGYYVMFTGAKTFSEENPSLIGFIMWVPNILSAMLLAFMMHKASRGVPLFGEERRSLLRMVKDTLRRCKQEES